MAPPKTAPATSCFASPTVIKLASQGYICGVCLEHFRTACSVPTAVRVVDRATKSCASCIVEANPDALAACTPKGVLTRSSSSSSKASTKAASTSQAELRTQRVLSKLKKVDIDKLDKLDHLESNIASILEKVCVLPEVDRRVEEHDARITKLEETSDTMAKRLGEMAEAGVGAAENPRVAELMSENDSLRQKLSLVRQQQSVNADLIIGGVSHVQ